MGTGLRIECGSLAESEKLAEHIADITAPGDIILLDGPLGAGKTTFCQFFGHALSVPDSCYITSPTFSLLHEYPGRLAMYHLDLYRLESEEEIEDLGFLEYIYSDGVSLVEWPDRLASLTPEEHLLIKIEPNGDESRLYLLKAFGEQWKERMKTLQSHFG